MFKKIILVALLSCGLMSVTSTVQAATVIEVTGSSLFQNTRISCNLYCFMKLKTAFLKQDAGTGHWYVHQEKWEACSESNPSDCDTTIINYDPNLTFGNGVQGVDDNPDDIILIQSTPPSMEH